MKLQFSVENNPGYDPEYPVAQWPFVLIVRSDSPLGLRWGFYRTLKEAEERQAYYMSLKGGTP